MDRVIMLNLTGSACCGQLHRALIRAKTQLSASSKLVITIEIVKLYDTGLFVKNKLNELELALGTRGKDVGSL